MKKLLIISLSLLSLSVFGQITNTNSLWSTNTTMIIIRTNIPFRLSISPFISGVSNVIGAGNAIFPSFHPTTNTWPNLGVVDFSTNESYGCTISGDVLITGFLYAGPNATNDPSGTIWFTNSAAVPHSVTVPNSVTTSTGAKVNYVTNALVSKYTFHFGYGMTNLTIVNYW